MLLSVGAKTDSCVCVFVFWRAGLGLVLDCNTVMVTVTGDLLNTTLLSPVSRQLRQPVQSPNYMHHGRWPSFGIYLLG